MTDEEPQTPSDANVAEGLSDDPGSPDPVRGPTGNSSGQDAGPSNSGDRYHFVYVARCMLAMLPPDARVQRTEVEGVAPEDLAIGVIDDRFVGVDVTEYEGGVDGRSANRVVLTQVKYSPTHPAHTWTLARLTASPPRRRRAGPERPRSVLGKLATAFKSLRDELATMRSGRPAPELVIRLHTNQPLDPTLRVHLESLRQTLRSFAAPVQPTGTAKPRSELPASANLLDDVAEDRVRNTHSALQAATGLTGSDLLDFLLAWDLDAFGQDMLIAEEGALFTALTTYVSDAGVQVGRLLSDVQERASALRRSSILRADVLGTLMVTEQDLWPAPPLFEPLDDLVQTDDARRLRAALGPATPVDLAGHRTRPVIDGAGQTTVLRGMEATSTATGHAPGSANERADLLVVHGPSGAGKTSTLRLLETIQGDGDLLPPVVVIYDSFANGQGLEPRSVRFPIAVCLTQIINELDARLHTGILVSARLDARHLYVRLEQAVAIAARIAAAAGRRLVLAFDAIDNAHQAAKDAPVRGESYVPSLFHIAWPRNCTVVVSARTENLSTLGIPDHARRLELTGFTLSEIAAVGSRSGETDADILRRLHDRTRGNPRVATRVLDALLQLRTEETGSTVGARLDLVDRTARENAFSYYRQEARTRLQTPVDRRTLATLAEATQSIDLGTLALVVRREVDEVRGLIERLAFGLRIDSNGVIAFRDQDFWDYAHEDFSAERLEARRTLAAFVRSAYHSHAYAVANFSRHLYAAGEFDGLVEWWLQDGRLAQAIDSATPYVERAFQDVQYALLAAVRTGRDADAVTLLALAGDVVHGRDLFAGHLVDHPEAVLALGALDEVLAELNGATPDSALVQRYAALAAAAAAVAPPGCFLLMKLSYCAPETTIICPVIWECSLPQSSSQTTSHSWME